MAEEKPRRRRQLPEDAPPDPGNHDPYKTQEEGAIIAELKKAVDELKERLGFMGGDECVGRVLTALLNEEVQRHFGSRVLKGEIFFNAVCLGNFVPEEDRILFEFRCTPPRICLVPKRFLVRLNIVDSRVIEVIDPAPALVPVSEQLPGAMFRFV
jgi:hypothetical protein